MIPMPPQNEVEPQALPMGAAVGSFVLRAVHSRDAFTIRYLAVASSSGAEVLIEEYAPGGLSVRDATGALAPQSPAHAPLWEEGLRAFLQESQVLAAPLHPALMRVASAWQIRGTALRMWPRVAGRSLADVCESLREPPTEAWLHRLIGPLLDALESLHDAGWVHGNVRPGQILMRDDGAPMLLDTGAVHKSIGARMPQHRAWPEPGFRAPELTDDANEPVPGPWSDLYSLAAVARCCIDAPCITQDWVPPAARSSGAHDSRFVAALQRALHNDPRQRPQSVAEFRRQLLATVETSAPSSPPERVPAARRAATNSWADAVEPERAQEPRQPWLEPMHADRPWEEAMDPLPRARRWPKAVAGVLGVGMLVAVAAYQLKGERPEPRAGVASAEANEEALLARNPPAAGRVLDAAPEQRDLPVAAVPQPEPVAPVPPPVTTSEPPRVEPAPPPRATLAAPAAPAVTLPATPAAACSPRTQFALYRCMQTQCEQRRFSTHPQCVQLRLTDEPPG
jgi:hypothetical protein